MEGRLQVARRRSPPTAYGRSGSSGADDLDRWIAERSAPAAQGAAAPPDEAVVLPSPGTPRTYTTEKTSDNRGAFGAALEDLGAFSAEAKAGGVPMAVLDCDLLKSTKTDLFAAKYPKSFIQNGIAEHNAAVVTGALSPLRRRRLVGASSGCSAEPGPAATPERHQQRERKLAVTHSSIDVGEGRQETLYRPLRAPELHGLGFHAGRPEPNEDRMWSLRRNHALVMGRSKFPSRSGGGSRSSRATFRSKRADRLRTGAALRSSPLPPISPGRLGQL